MLVDVEEWDGCSLGGLSEERVVSESVWVRCAGRARRRARAARRACRCCTGAQRALFEHRGGRAVCAARGGRALRWLRCEGGVAAHAAEAHELLTEAAPGENIDEHVERGERVIAVGGELPVGRRQVAPVPHDVRQLEEREAEGGELAQIQEERREHHHEEEAALRGERRRVAPQRLGERLAHGEHERHVKRRDERHGHEEFEQQIEELVDHVAGKRAFQIEALVVRVNAHVGRDVSIGERIHRLDVLELEQRGRGEQHAEEQEERVSLADAARLVGLEAR